jgi:hypothetical protein
MLTDKYSFGRFVQQKYYGREDILPLWRKRKCLFIVIMTAQGDRKQSMKL